MGIVGRYAYEIAELYYGSLKAEGLTVDMVQVDDEWIRIERERGKQRIFKFGLNDWFHTSFRLCVCEVIIVYFLFIWEKNQIFLKRIGEWKTGTYYTNIKK